MLYFVSGSNHSTVEAHSLWVYLFSKNSFLFAYQSLGEGGLLVASIVNPAYLLILFQARVR
jgi:hypothetical protein